MLKYKTPSGTGIVENRWSELSPMQFVEAVKLTNQFVSGAITGLDEYRLRLLEMLTGYKRRKKRRKHADQINENLYLISEQLNFAILPDVGPPEVLEFFSPELRELLGTRFPWEIYEPEYVAQMRTVQRMMTVNFRVNFNLEKNPLPVIRKGNELFKGPVFSTENGDLETNLKTGPYLDASEYFNAYVETKKEKYLERFFTTLYVQSEPTVPHLGDEERQRRGGFVPLTEGDETPSGVGGGSVPNFAESSVKDALVMLFIYIQQTFATDPVFSILFQHNENTGTGKLHLGSDEAIGALVEAGYGNHNEVANLDICTFFNYQIMFIRKNVETLRSMKKSPGEISKLINLPITTIQKL